MLELLSPISFLLQTVNIFGTIVLYNIFEEMDMKKISVTMLFVLALALLVGCTNAATGGTGSGSETENDYLAPLLGTWKTEGYDEGKFVEMEQVPGTIWEVRSSCTYTEEMMIKSVDEKNICTVDSSGWESKDAYRLDNTNGKKLLYWGSYKKPFYWSN